MPNKAVYLTFDDGPLGGTDDVIAILNATKAKGTLFMVGEHIRRSEWTRKQVNAACASPYVEVGNHSNTHAKGRYQEYYSNPDKVVEGFREAQKVLCLPQQGRKIARLPGRNTWRVGGILQNDRDSGAAANKLVAQGYIIYGWDVEWRNKETPTQMLKKIQSALSSNKTKKKDKVIVLTHDVMFKASTGGKKKLKDLIGLLKKENFNFDLVSKY